MFAEITLKLLLSPSVGQDGGVFFSSEKSPSIPSLWRGMGRWGDGEDSGWMFPLPAGRQALKKGVGGFVSLAIDQYDRYTRIVLVCKNCMMTTLTINKENAQSVIEIIIHRLEQGDMLIDLYDDESCNPIVRSWSSDDYLSVLDTMIVEDENHRA